MHFFSKELCLGLTELFFPSVCLHCGEAVESDSRLSNLCASCARMVHLIRSPACSTCGHPFYGEMHDERICPHCEGLIPEFNEGRSLVLFRGATRSLMLALKYHRGLYVLKDFSRLLRESPSLVAWLANGILIPVPMHPLKRRERGYNQTELIAESFIGVVGPSLRLKPLLVRTEYSCSQTAFDRQARLMNLKNAFALAPGVLITPAERYILLDDVFTTGSTLNRCASVLRKAGARRIDVITFAHG